MLGRMSMITIILFFIYTYGLGFSITHFFKNSDNFLERNLMRIGIGIGVIPFLIVLFDFLHVPIDWRIFLIVSLAVPVFVFLRNIKGFKVPILKLSRLNLYVLVVLVIFSLTLFMYVKGAFIYPYFEDDDPWAHATGIKYVSIEKRVDDPNGVLTYIEPYPPGYDGLMGILHQTSPSLMWTMKFFNALIISLGIIFFYFFSKSFMGHSRKALIATSILAMVPCYLSHFIWAHSLIMTLLIVALYCLSMIDYNKGWIYPSLLVIASICVTQPTQPIKFLFLFLTYFVVKSIYSRKFLKKEFLVIIGGYLLSVVWWAFNWKAMFHKEAKNVESAVTEQSNIISRLWDVVMRTFRYDQGTATRPYTFNDFFVAKSQNMINNPIGVGVVLSLLVVFSLVIIFFTYRSMKREKKTWVITTLIWLLFTFLGINSMTFKLPIGFFAFRFWMLFAIPLSIIAAEGFWFLLQFLKQFKIPKIVVIALLIILIFYTSGKQKYAVNTATWGPGQMWTSGEEISGYVWLKGLPADTKVFAYSSDEQVIGFDKFSCLWCDEVIDFRKDLLQRNISEVYSWLRARGYGYMIIDGMTYRNFGYEFGENETNEIVSKRLQEISAIGKFNIAYQTKGMVIFQLM